MSKNEVNGCGVVILFVLAVAAVVAFNGWWLMLLWGAIAGAMGWQTIGYGTAVLISLLLAFIGGFFKRAS